MAEIKTKPTTQTATDYLNSLVDNQKRLDCLEIIKLMQAATENEPVMWGTSIIGFGKYHYKYASGQEGDWPRIGLSARKNNLTLYFMSGFDTMQALLKDLGKHKVSKSCLYIKRLSDINLDVLKKIIKHSLHEMSIQYPQ